MEPSCNSGDRPKHDACRLIGEKTCEHRSCIRLSIFLPPFENKREAKAGEQIRLSIEQIDLDRLPNEKGEIPKRLPGRIGTGNLCQSFCKKEQHDKRDYRPYEPRIHLALKERQW